LKHFLSGREIVIIMRNRFPIEFFEQLARKNMLRDDADPETTLVDDVDCDKTKEFFPAATTISDEATEIL